MHRSSVINKYGDVTKNKDKDRDSWINKTDNQIEPRNKKKIARSGFRERNRERERARA